LALPFVCERVPPRRRSAALVAWFLSIEDDRNLELVGSWMADGCALVLLSAGVVAAAVVPAPPVLGMTKFWTYSIIVSNVLQANFWKGLGFHGPTKT